MGNEYKGRFPACLWCEGLGALPCSVCRGGDPDCERCEGTDQETCLECERVDMEQRKWADGIRPKVVNGGKGKR